MWSTPFEATVPVPKSRKVRDQRHRDTALSQVMMATTRAKTVRAAANGTNWSSTTPPTEQAPFLCNTTKTNREVLATFPWEHPDGQ
jgi:hypothetical protein